MPKLGRARKSSAATSRASDESADRQPWPADDEVRKDEKNAKQRDKRHKASDEKKVMTFAIHHWLCQLTGDAESVFQQRSLEENCERLNEEIEKLAGAKNAKTRLETVSTTTIVVS